MAERLAHPRVPSAKLSGHKNRDKLKLRTVGYRLADEVQVARFVVIVVAVGRRDRNAVYHTASER